VGKFLPVRDTEKFGKHCFTFKLVQAKLQTEELRPPQKMFSMQAGLLPNILFLVFQNFRVLDAQASVPDRSGKLKNC